MEASFKVREKEYQADIHPADSPDRPDRKDEKFKLYSVAVRGQGEAVGRWPSQTNLSRYRSCGRASYQGRRLGRRVPGSWLRAILSGRGPHPQAEARVFFVVDHRWIQEV